MLTIAPARDTASLDDAKAIFLAYAEWIERQLGYSLARQSFACEMEGFPGRYAPPGGDVVLARLDGKAAGAIAFYRFNDSIAELKRFYVLPEMAGHGVGGALFDVALKHARDVGYGFIRLDTLKGMEHARRLYARYAFNEIAPYNENYKDTPDILYYELDLATI